MFLSSKNKKKFKEKFFACCILIYAGGRPRSIFYDSRYTTSSTIFSDLRFRNRLFKTVVSWSEISPCNNNVIDHVRDTLPYFLFDC